MDKLASLLDKPMDRRDFLKHLGLGAALVLGGGVVDRLLFTDSRSKRHELGYGSSNYGGRSRP